jgi:hypothetical protein
MLMPKGIKGLSENDCATLQAWSELVDWTGKNASPRTQERFKYQSFWSAQTMASEQRAQAGKPKEEKKYHGTIRDMNSSIITCAFFKFTTTARRNFESDPLPKFIVPFPSRALAPSP